MAYTKTVWGDTTPINKANLNKIENGIADLYDAIFPVGQIVIKGDNADYSNWLGFTWQRTAVGRVLVGIDSNDTSFDTIGETGGEKNVTLSVAEMPSHTHYLFSYDGGSTPIPTYTARDNGTSGTTEINCYASTTAPRGDSSPHNNLQPYQVVAYWKRTA